MSYFYPLVFHYLAIAEHCSYGIVDKRIVAELHAVYAVERPVGKAQHHGKLAIMPSAAAQYVFACKLARHTNGYAAE